MNRLSVRNSALTRYDYSLPTFRILKRPFVWCQSPFRERYSGNKIVVSYKNVRCRWNALKIFSYTVYDLLLVVSSTLFTLLRLEVTIFSLDNVVLYLESLYGFPWLCRTLKLSKLIEAVLHQKYFSKSVRISQQVGIDLPIALMVCNVVSPLLRDFFMY